MTKVLAQKELDSRPGADSGQSPVNPATAGLPALDTGDMYSGMDVRSAAGGGIIAFAEGETVPKPFDPFEEYIAGRDKLRKQAEKAEFSKEAALGRALLPVGQSLMLGKRTGGGGLSDILAGAAPGITKGAEMYVAEKGAANKLQQSAAEKEAELSAGIYRGDIAAKASAAKPTDMRNYINDYVKAARAQGDTTTPDEVLRNKGADRYLALYGAAGARGTAALTTAETGAGKVTSEYIDKARDNVDKRITDNPFSPTAKELKSLRKQDKEIRATGKESNLAQNYLDGLYKKEEEVLRGRNKAPSTDTPKPGATSNTSDAPAGTTKGKLVPGKGYEALDKNGKLVGYFQP